jgi:hypothetical protein
VRWWLVAATVPLCALTSTASAGCKPYPVLRIYRAADGRAHARYLGTDRALSPTWRPSGPLHLEPDECGESFG